MPNLLERAGRARGGLRARPVGWVGPDRGSVTAETALVLPVLVAVTLGLLWLVSVAVTQVRVVDAARETARAVARDEPEAQAVARGARVAPEGARIAVGQAGGEVRVRVVAVVRGPGGIWRFLPSLDVEAEAVTAQEDS